MQAKQIAAIGCSGEIAQPFIEGFIQQGFKVRLLARDDQKARERFPTVEVIKGSMLNPDDVQRTLQGVDTAFLITPVGVRNNKASEVEAARSVILGAQRANLGHLIYVSVLNADKANELSLIDAKHDVEVLLANSGVPWTAIRTGSYMEDVFDIRLHQFEQGKFLFPVNKERRFTYTCQEDIPRFIAERLNAPLNRGFNFVSPGTYSILQLEKLLSQLQGRPVTAPGRGAFYYVLKLLQPVFHLAGHKFSTIIPLVDYFNKYGYVDRGETVADLFPEFVMTPLEAHLQQLFMRRR